MASFPLKIGSKGSEVKKVQEFLNIAAELNGLGDRLTVDGDYGGKTAALLSKILARTEVTSGDYKLGLDALPVLKNRLAKVKRGGANYDKQLREFIKANEQIFYNLLDIYKHYKAAKAAGKEKQYAAEYTEAYKIGMRYKNRIAKMMSPEMQKQLFARRGVKTSYSQLAKEVSEGGVGEIGFLPLLPLAIVAVVGLFVGTISGWFSSERNNTHIDWKKSNEIKGILGNLTPEQQDKVTKDVENQLDKAYDKGYKDGKPGFLDNLTKGGKNMVFGAILAAAVVFAGPPIIKAIAKK